MNQKAVSPVIGVMLMIVATVALAAAVSSWSGSIADVKKAPSGVFQVEILKTGAGMSDRIQFRYLSGDRIPTKDLEIVFIAKGVMTEVLPNSDNVNYTFDGTNWTSYTAPWRFIPGERVGSYPEHEFGNYTLAPGTTFKGCYFAGYQGFNGTDDVHAMIKNWDDLTTDDIVTVKIVHTPSGRVIWQAEVPVKG